MDNILDKINEQISNKEFESAKIQLEDLLKEDEHNIEAMKMLGLCNVNLKLYDEGRAIFETVVKYKNDDATSWFYLGSCYDNMDDFLHAETAYKQVIALREDYLDAYSNLAIIYLRSGSPDKALPIALSLLEKDSDSAKTYYLVGTTYLALRDVENCIVYLSKAAELNPENAQTYNNLGTAYLSAGNHQAALENYLKATELSLKNPLTYFNIGSILQLQNKNVEACEYFEKAYEIEKCEQYMVALALSEYKSAQYEKAIEHYKYLSEKYPDKHNFIYNLACCYEQLNQQDEAIELMEKLVRKNPKSVLMAQKLSTMYIQQHRYEEAKGVYEQLIMQGSITASLYHQYAMLCMQTNDIDTAERIFKKVIELEPNSAQTHKDLGVIYLNKRLFEYAEDEFNKALELEPDDNNIQFEYANFLHAVGNYLKAEKYYKDVVTHDEKNPQVLTFAAKNKMALNDNEAAVALLEKAIKLAPNDDYALYLCGKANYMIKDYDCAKRYLIAAYEINKNIETENVLALTYYSNEEFQQAANIFEAILKQNPNNSLMLLNTAKCYEQLKDNDKALEYAEKSVEIFADNEESQEMIRRLS